MKSRTKSPSATQGTIRRRRILRHLPLRPRLPRVADLESFDTITMNDVLKISAGVVLAVATLAPVGVMVRYALGMLLPLAIALLFSVGVAVAWRRLVPKKKDKETTLP